VFNSCMLLFLYILYNNNNNNSMQSIMMSIGLPLAVSAGILSVLAGHFQWTGCWFAVSPLEVSWKSLLD